MPLDRDSRSTRMIRDYEKMGLAVLQVIWTRGEPAPSNPGVIAFTGAGRYGQKFANAFSYLRWHLFIARTLLKYVRTATLVHVVDLDTAIVAVPLARLAGKSVVYDAFDQFASMFRDKSFLRNFFAAIERWLMARSAILIFPDSVRLHQYGILEDERICILGNIPDMTAEGAALPESIVRDRGAVAFTYIGTLEALHRGLEFIPLLCEHFGDRVQFLVGGVGRLEMFFREQAGRLANLKFVGHQTYDEALRLMRQADCLYGPYLLSAEAHRYASPNKMYEHLALGRPLLTNTGTPPGAFVEEHGTGFIFDGNYANLTKLVDQLTPALCAERGKIAKKLWDDIYASLREHQIGIFSNRLEILMASGKTRNHGDMPK